MAELVNCGFTLYLGSEKEIEERAVDWLNSNPRREDEREELTEDEWEQIEEDVVKITENVIYNLNKVLSDVKFKGRSNRGLRGSCTFDLDDSDQVSLVASFSPEVIEDILDPSGYFRTLYTGVSELGINSIPVELRFLGIPKDIQEELYQAIS